MADDTRNAYDDFMAFVEELERKMPYGVTVTRFRGRVSVHFGIPEEDRRGEPILPWPEDDNDG